MARSADTAGLAFHHAGRLAPDANVLAWLHRVRPPHRVDAAACLAFGLVGLFVLTAILAPLIEPHDPLAQDVARRLKPPGYVDPRADAFWLGTDGLGRDIVARLIVGARVSLLVGIGGAAPRPSSAPSSAWWPATLAAGATP